MSIVIIAIPLLLIVIVYLLFFRQSKGQSKGQRQRQDGTHWDGAEAEVVTQSLEERVRRRMGKST